MGEFTKGTQQINEVSDEDNPKFMFQTLSTKLILAMATGKINAQEYAKFEMQNRGFGKNGKWVGFPESAKIWKAKVK